MAEDRGAAVEATTTATTDGAASSAAGGDRCCKVCLQHPQKYKCPRCRLPYCSAACYKRHSSTPCEVVSRVTRRPQPEVLPPRQLDEDDVSDSLSPAQLAALAQSQTVRDMLANHHLRNLLDEIDDSANAPAAMKRARHIPLFTEFADACLTELGIHPANANA
ncbi:uncharacterized protein MONBRDRAFT_12569 [Monosiga brevicollis MX1]|uniref:Zinc finger HIT domain-containing protein 3 n=1 Tax=Monosiga brevicollis TaxID=81824 RepID=A9VCN7_MONBE|nr:uncharacterized protein MONBRDRAFT_12569 [Monosiga brevicollis MX1]EDQ84717.1 predicted protein [Monosiga brevicollis MX1]|eukprot:XP_001750503.1 hypothetical protein [Monosiga brevicollis MX1]